MNRRAGGRRQETDNPRLAALQIINEVIINRAYVNLAVMKVLPNLGNDGQKRRFAAHLAYGTVRMWKRLDWQLNFYLRRDIGQLPPVIANILRLGLFQLLNMPSVPPPAVVDQSVELAKKFGHRGTVGLVNGVLRSLLRNPAAVIWPKRDRDPAGWMSVRHAFPRWLVERLLRQWPEQRVNEYLTAVNQSVRPAVRVNTLRATREEVIGCLIEAGAVATGHPAVDEGIVVEGIERWPETVAGLAGKIYWQSLGAQIAAHILSPRPGEVVLDLCAAPGGKATHLAALMNNCGRLIACDRHPHRVSLIDENAAALGVTIIESQVWDATKVNPAWLGMADRVLVDAPCSGLGVIGHRADLRWRLDPSVLDELPDVQLSILASADRYLKTGGRLLYCTCTLNEEENERVIGHFRRRFRGYRWLDLGRQWRPWLELGETGFGKIWPSALDGNGFFFALAEKTG
ncbi:MAG: 16S rRNA (cytosine(967)-C(5))-methyltransferase RsmB [Negativicutes bacterium]|nr:16S rRNA (cytosine(967)-C(5))-methyltransferase RsmB [Negativicutes bacterium]